MIHQNYINLNEVKEIKAGQCGKGLLIERDGYLVGEKDTIKQIHEDIDNHHKFVIPDNFIVHAVFQKYGIKNANGRIYPEKVLKREVQNYIENQIASRTSIGALDHPASSSLSGHDVTHKILNLEWEGRTLVGEMKLHLSPGYIRYGICSTSGDLAANLILDEILIGVSSRALGSVEDKYGSLIVGDDLQIIGWDIVMENSTPGAKISVDREGLEQYIESKENTDTYNKIEDRLSRIKSILNM